MSTAHDPAGLADAAATASGAIADPELAVVAFGANLGDRRALIASALAALASEPGVELVDVSPLYETPALKLAGVAHDAPRYLNGVARVRTRLTPLELLAVLQRIELDHGRERLERWGDRTLDLDLVDHGRRVQDDDRLTLPHPRAGGRAFVLQPWLDLDPGAELPGLGPIAALRAIAEDEVRPAGAIAAPTAHEAGGGRR